MKVCSIFCIQESFNVLYCGEMEYNTPGECNIFGFECFYIVGYEYGTLQCCSPPFFVFSNCIVRGRPSRSSYNSFVSKDTFNSISDAAWVTGDCIEIFHEREFIY